MCPVDRNTPSLITPSSSGTVVTGSFLKATAGARTGISVARRHRDGAIVISRIEPGTMASTTTLKPGMRFLSINDKPITHTMSCQEVANILIQASGMVSVVASRGIAGALFKESPEMRTGVTLGKTVSGKIIISKIAPYSLAATESPQLRAGMPVSSINNVSVKGLSTQEAADLLIKSTGVVTIAAYAA